MKHTEQEFTKDTMFAYGLRRKVSNAAILVGVLIIAISLLVTYALVLRGLDVFPFTAIDAITNHMFTTIAQGTLLGAFYTTFVGGLFFVVVPMELLFTRLIVKGNPWALVLLLYLLGMTLSYTLNYIIGQNLAGIAKSIISVKKFYSIKATLNKHGSWGIFFINALPLPSQPLSVILGVFRYNKAKFYTYFLLGQTAKYLVLVIAVLLIL